MALTNKLSAIADAIRSKTGGTHLLTLDEMPTAIRSIKSGGTGGIPEEALTISGNCLSMFTSENWNWFVELYGNQITTKDITTANDMFAHSSLTDIPFDINLKSGWYVNCDNMFVYSDIVAAPYIKGEGKVSSIDKIFSYCSRLSYIPEDWADYIDWDYLNTHSSMYQVFNACNSLRRIPQNILPNLWDTNTGVYSIYYFCFNACNVLDEVNNLGVQPELKNNTLDYTFNSCNMIKNITFATNEDGSAKTAKWKSQVLDLSKYTGYAQNATDITNRSQYHGITEDKRVVDHITYNALKDDADWWTTNQYFSKYNKTSALATINSLPDTSEYLAANSGTNTIKFKGLAGCDTDGGAINTLTEEEIAIAAAKGWTVTFV